VTFLFTDIEGSTRALYELGPERYAQELARHRDLMRRSFAEHHGIEIDTQGDAFFVAFNNAQNAFDAAQSAQLRLAGGAVAVRMGIHTGEPLVWAEGYVGVDVHRGARICAAAHGGQIVVSERTRELVEGPLVDLGFHRLKDLSEPQHLFQLGEDDFPALRTLHTTNLPVQTSRLVGRARELADAAEILASHRLVSLIGPGGSGKTRLGLQLAADVADEYPDGVFWVPLQAVRDPELVLPAVASAVGAKGARLSDHIADRKLLLLLDNLEQVVEAAPLLAEALSEMPNIKLITTSREPLRIQGEQRYPVEPLPEDDAVSLFNERASAVNRSFQPTQSVAEICRRLDRLPLALELAAARVAVLHPDALLTRLEHSLPVLTYGARDAPERQRTLRATLDWSFDLLGPEEQTHFARLGVFEGGFDAESAEAVCGVGLDALQSLVEKSLVRHWGGGRFGMLETVHEFAVERFVELPDHDEVRRLHAEHFIALAESARRELRGETQGTWLDRLETEGENFRAALTWSADSGRLDLTCRLAAGFSPFWGTRGSLAEGRQWLEATLQARESLAPEHRAPYVRWTAQLSFLNGEPDRAWALYEEALALSRAQGDAEGEGLALMDMGHCAYDAGRFDDAVGLLEQGADAFRRLGTGWGLPAIAGNLGNLAVERGDYERAEQLYTESLEGYRALNSPPNVLPPLVNLANLCVERGSPSEAAGPLREAFEIAVSAQSRLNIAYVLDVYSRVAVAEGSWQRAAVLFGARDHLLEVMAARLQTREDESRAVRERETVEAELGATAFREAWAEGASMELNAVVRYVKAAG
jgi:predicted ATPase